MDVLEPELIWVNGRCYRFYESSLFDNQEVPLEPYMEDEQIIHTEEESESEIEMVSRGGNFVHTFYVPKAFYPFIIGIKGTTRKKLETDTKTKIVIPRNENDTNIVITGQNRSAVISARHRIDLLIETSRKKIRYTHFLSIPLNKEEIIDKFHVFKNDVLEKYTNTTYNIDESLFQSPYKLHLTIGMLTLLDDNEKKQAVDALINCKKDIIDPILEKTGLINIRLQGVACMNDDPTNTRVLYAEIADKEKLQEIVDKVVEYFVDKGIKEKENGKIKLHVTLMNQKFRVKKKQGKYKERFNTSEILETYKDTLFGETVLSQIDISELHSAKKDNYYNAIGNIIF